MFKKPGKQGNDTLEAVLKTGRKVSHSELEAAALWNKAPQSVQYWHSKSALTFFISIFLRQARNAAVYMETHFKILAQYFFQNHCTGKIKLTCEFSVTIILNLYIHSVYTHCLYNCMT